MNFLSLRAKSKPVQVKTNRISVPKKTQQPKKIKLLKEEKNQVNEKTDLIDKYRACMLLSAVGDAMGYKNGDWEFNTSSKLIHQKMMEMTNQKGIKQLNINMEWRYSDDTVMHIATANALISQRKNLKETNKVAQQIAVDYKISGTKMAGRAPGKTCMKSIQILNANGSNWNQIPYNTRSVGCGGSMRSACIGLAYSKPQQLYDLIKVSIQAGRITHHNPIGYLGSMVSAFFTSLAIQGVHPRLWVRQLFVNAFPLCEKYIKQADRQTEKNLTSEYWETFISFWQDYAKQRKVATQKGEDKEPFFPKEYNVEQREHFYRKISFASWPGASGLDSTIIAYDALLGAQYFEKDSEKWEQFCLRGILHGGDNDSTGAIGGAWFGAMHGFKGVPDKNYQKVEDNVKLKRLGEDLYNLSRA